jgi:hypothetical protein
LPNVQGQTAKCFTPDFSGASDIILGYALLMSAAQLGHAFILLQAQPPNFQVCAFDSVCKSRVCHGPLRMQNAKALSAGLLKAGMRVFRQPGKT